MKTENDRMKIEIMKKEAQEREIERIKEENKLTKLENQHLKYEVQQCNEILQKFLNHDQITALSIPPRQWDNKTIIKGLKMRFSLGVHGYDYL